MTRPPDERPSLSRQTLRTAIIVAGATLAIVVGLVVIWNAGLCP
jgi:hypothetical protein